MKKNMILVIALSFATLSLLAESTCACQKFFTSPISPVTTYTGSPNQPYIMTVVNSPSNPSGNKLGSAIASIPSGFAVTVSSLSVTAPSGKIWKVTLASGQVKFTAVTSGDCINPSQNVTVRFNATAPTAPGSYPWNTTAYTNPSWSGDRFTLSGSQPAVTVIQAITMNVSYRVLPDDSTPTLAPAFNYYLGGFARTYTLTKTATSIKVDQNSPWSVTPGSMNKTSDERWYSNDPLKGTASSDCILNPIYYHQFAVAWTYSVSDNSAINPTPVLSGAMLGQSVTSNLSTSLWLDAGSSWSMSNPVVAVSGTEQWIATSGTSGVVSASVIVDPLYYHQFLVSFAVSPSSMAGTTDPSGTNWENAGELTINATINFGYIFSSWNASLPITVDNASSSLTTANIIGSGTITAIFTSNNGVASVTTGTNVQTYPNTDVGLNFNNVTQAGSVYAYATDAYDSIPPPSSGSFVGSIWNITTTAGFSDKVTVGVVIDTDSLPAGTNITCLRLWQVDFVLGDVNHDGKVDCKDLAIILAAMGSKLGDKNWNPDCDLNHDGKVGLADFAIAFSDFGKTSQWVDITTWVDTVHGIVYGVTDHFSGFGIHQE